MRARRVTAPNNIDDVAGEMLRIMRSQLGEVRWSAPEHMRHQRIAIQRAFGPATISIDAETLEARLLQLASEGVPNSPTELRDCLAALHLSVNLSEDDDDQERWSPIADPIMFDDLLAAAVNDDLTPRWRDRCMASLLHCYLTYDGPGQDSDGMLAARWRRIGATLTTYASSAGDQRVGAVLALHKDLFGPNPAKGYGAAALDGDEEVLDRLRSDLSIPESSWFWRELLIAQAQELGNRPDDEFERAWPHLLREARKHPAVLDGVLGKILDRYLKNAGAPEQNELRDLAFERWKNPMLEANRAKWLTFVQKRTFDAVLNWIKLRLIDEFFEYLATDAATDQLRPQFWKGYVEHIDDMLFFLGESAAETLMLNSLRTRMAGKVRRIDHPDSNAFAMVIGGRAYIEFSTYSNALYEYPASFLSELPTGRTIPLTALRREEGRRRLAHLMSNPKNRWVHSGAWPGNFADRIYALSGVRPARTRRW